MDDQPISVLLTKYHAMFCQGFKEMLAIDGNLEVAGESENGKEALQLVAETLLDVLSSLRSTCRS